MIFADKCPNFTSTYSVYTTVNQCVFVKALVGAFSRNSENSRRFVDNSSGQKEHYWGHFVRLIRGICSVAQIKLEHPTKI